jgi:hypothetical protein
MLKNISYRMLKNISYRMLKNISYKMLKNISYRMLLDVCVSPKNKNEKNIQQTSNFNYLAVV